MLNLTKACFSASTLWVIIWILTLSSFVSIAQSGSPSLVSFTLIDAENDTDIGPLNDGDTLILNLLPTDKLNVRANTNPSQIDKVIFDFNGTNNFRSEGAAPYALHGDKKGDYNEWTPAPGAHILTATPKNNGVFGSAYTVNFYVITQAAVDCNGDVNGAAFLDDCGACAGGNTGVSPNQDKDSCGVCFGDGTTCANCNQPTVQSLSLINTNNNADLGIINEGDTIDETQIFNFSIRANVCNHPTGSVEFIVDGNSFNIDNADPFSINGNSNGFYNSWNADSGMHTITAVPYTQANATGTPGDSLSLSVLIIDTGYVDTNSYGAFPNLVCDSFPGGRIAMSFDGNLHDSDDYVSMPMAMAMLYYAGLRNRLVHLEYNIHLGISDSSQEYEMRLSAHGAQQRFGYDPAILFDAISDPDSTSDALAAAINASSPSSPLWILAGGPMETIARGLAKSDSSKRQFVRIISHSGWNEAHTHFGPPLYNDWADLLADYTADSVQFVQIPDMNAGFKGPRSKWRWLIKDPDPNFHWLYGRNRTSAFDCSDAGMTYWLISGGDVTASTDQVRGLFELPCPPTCGCPCDSNIIGNITAISPSDGDSIASDSAIVIKAMFADPDSNTSYVAFYSLDSLLGVDSTSAYELSISGLDTGSYGLYMKAVDSCGTNTYTDTIHIVVQHADCAGILAGTAYLDDCSTCVGGTTGLIPNQDKDSCGVCFGDGMSCAPIDCFGDTLGAAFIDSCGNCAGGNTGIVPNDSCTDCAGVINGVADYDNCGVCSGGSTGLIPDASCTDCNGIVNGTAQIDTCGICAGGNTGITPGASCSDCNGDPLGTAAIDSCGVCAGGNTGVVINSSCTDCNGDLNGTASLDSCGTCSGGNTGLVANANCVDCNGDLFGTAVLDTCGACTGGNTGLVAGSSCSDCNGDPYGTASIDSCGTCSGGNTGLIANANCIDCNGDLFGSAVIDTCGVCAGGNTGVVAGSSCTDCHGDPYGTARIDSCGICAGGNTGIIANTSCTDCKGVLNGTASIDTCGICAGGNTGITPNASCTDCNGVLFGTAITDTCGVCAGGNTGILINQSCVACAANEVVSFTLMQAGQGGGPIRQLVNGDYIYTSLVAPFSIRADICDSGLVGSVEFTLDGTRLRVENSAPYSINGDNKKGFKNWNPANGTYILSGIPYSNGNANGTQGIAETIEITIATNPPLIDCHGDTNGTAYIDLCGVCAAGNTGITPNTACLDCHGDLNGTATIDSCGICSGGNTGLLANASCKDCAGIVNGSAAIDSCGLCTGGTTGFVTNASCTDCNGVVNGTAVIDSCGICTLGNTGLSFNTICNYDCHGDLNGTAFVDSCGICAAGNTSVQPNVSCTDCQGIINGQAYIDSCGVCSGGATGITPNASCTDCHGVINGLAIIDSCGVCAGGTTTIIPNSSCTDCHGVIHGLAIIDSCGVCAGGNTGNVPNSSCTDCNGDINGSASTDACGVCSGGNTGLVPNASCTDCNGVVNGTASLDSCGLCAGGNTGIVPNSSCLDCNGDINGTALIDSCGICSGGNTGLIPNESCKDCNGVVNGTAIIDSCGICAGGNTGQTINASCSDCNGDVYGLASIDSCGTCSGGNTGLIPNDGCRDCNAVINGTAFIDSCGLCAGGNTGITPDSACADCYGDPNGTAAIDSCGICSGGNSGLIPNDSCRDCNNVLYGSAAIDTCGVCAGGTTGIVPNQSCIVCQPNEVISFTLMQAVSGGAPIRQLLNGDVLYLSSLGPFSIRADICNNGIVGSVEFLINGNLIRTESAAPYAINGDKSGNYTPWNPGPGTYVLTGIPYSNSGGNGTPGVAETLSFTVFVDPPVVDCHGDLGGTAFVDNCGICSGGNTGLIPNASCSDCHGDINGTAIIDSCGICSGGNTGILPNSTCGGSCVPNQVTTLMLIDAATSTDLGPMMNGDTIDLQLLPDFSVRADVCSDPDVQSVIFFLDGIDILTENVAPYAVNGDNNGFYNPWLLGVGYYTLSVTPYSGNNGSGSDGISKSVGFYVVDGQVSTDCNGDIGGTAYIDGCGQCVGGNTGATPCDSKTLNGISINIDNHNFTNGINSDFSAESLSSYSVLTSDQLSVLVYPNPTNGLVSIDIKSKEGKASIELYDATGKLIHQQEQQAEENVLDLRPYAKGLYWVKVHSRMAVKMQRIFKN